MSLILTEEDLANRIGRWKAERGSLRSSDGSDFKWETAGFLSEVRRAAAWELIGRNSFREFTEKTLRLKSKLAGQMADVFDNFENAGLTFEEMQTIPWRNARVIAPLVNSEDRDKWLELAKEFSVRDLTGWVRSCGATQKPKRTPTNTRVTPVTEWTRPMPGCGFFVQTSNWQQLCFAATHSQNALLLGHSGAGKTELCVQVAKALGRPTFTLNFGATSEPRTSLIGTMHFSKDRGTWFAESRFLKAIRTPGTVIIMDELSRCRPEAFNIILPLLDGQKTVAIDENPDTDLVRVADGVTFLATANQGLQYTGAETLDQAILDRFHIIIHLDFPPQEQEVGILVQRTGIDQKHAEMLVRIAADQRALAADGAFLSPVSTRTLLSAAAQIAAGIPLRQAMKFCVASRFSSDGASASERSQFEVLIQKLLGDE